jgi:hypothetical protein
MLRVFGVFVLNSPLGGSTKKHVLKDTLQPKLNTIRTSMYCGCISVISIFALLCKKIALCYELQNYMVIFLFLRKIKEYASILTRASQRVNNNFFKYKKI